MKKLSFLLIFVLIINAKNTSAQADIAEAGIQKIMQEEKVVGFSVAVVKKIKLFTHIHLGCRILKKIFH